MKDIREVVDDLKKEERQRIMEKKELSALDIRFLVKELKETLEEGIIQKIYQYGAKQFIFDIYITGAGSHFLYFDSSKIFITKNKEPAPQEPPAFCMLLRKHITGKRIRGIKQHDFDRVIELQTDDNILIIELMAPGNVILCDTNYNIIMPLENQEWKDREVKPRIPYKYPPKVNDPFRLEFGEIMALLRRSDKNIVAFLATDLGLGGLYATEICHRGGIERTLPAKDMSLQEVSSLHNAIESITRVEFRPSVYRETVSPFVLTTHKESPQTYQTFSDALDDFFKEQMLRTEEAEQEKQQTEIAKKEERIATRQATAMEKWADKEKMSRSGADVIYRNYPVVQAVLDMIKTYKDSGLSWNEIKEKTGSKDSPETRAVKEIKENEGLVIIELEGEEIELDIRKTVEQNAAMYYEDAKKAKRKTEAIEKAMESRPVPEPPREVVVKRKWYERFKWFVSSEGFLVIAGRSAEQNERLMKRHRSGKDIVFHADIPGSAFVLVRSDGRDMGEETKKEAAEFSAANSRAWSRGLGTVDVMSVPADRVTKTPPSGEYLAKGSFIMAGERTWYRNVELKMCVGIKIEGGLAHVVSGPLMAVRKNSDYFVTIKPGPRKAAELSADVKNKILIKAKPEDKHLIERIPMEEIERVIPSGVGEIVER